MCLSSGRDQFKAQPKAWGHVCARGKDSVCMCVCVCMCDWVCVTECVWSVPWSDSCTPSSWMEKASLWWLPSGTHVSPTSFLVFFLFYFPFPYLCVTLQFPRRQWLYADQPLISSMFLLSSALLISTLSVLLLPSLFLFYYYTPITITTRIWNARCCSLQNEMHLSQLNL